MTFLWKHIDHLAVLTKRIQHLIVCESIKKHSVTALGISNTAGFLIKSCMIVIKRLDTEKMNEVKITPIILPLVVVMWKTCLVKAFPFLSFMYLLFQRQDLVI